MQIHGPSEVVDRITVRSVPGGKPLAVVSFGRANVFLESVADADELIVAALKAKALLSGETDDAGTDAP